MCSAAHCVTLVTGITSGCVLTVVELDRLLRELCFDLPSDSVQAIYDDLDAAASESSEDGLTSYELNALILKRLDTNEKLLQVCLASPLCI